MGRSGLCTICGVSFKRLDEHMKHVHVQTEDYLNCDFCSKTFTKKKSKSDYMMKVHKNRFACAKKNWGREFKDIIAIIFEIYLF